MAHQTSVAAALACLLAPVSVTLADITLLGKASIPGDALDKSGLTGLAGEGVPHNRLGSFGSAIDYTGRDDLYIACDDRGPGNGSIPFQTRFQTFRIALHPGSEPAVSVELVGTTLLTDEAARPLTGAAAAFDAADQRKGARLDPEGIRCSGTGTLFISDEYGPWIDEFSLSGKRLRRLDIPPRFMIDHPSAEARGELPPVNTRGRQSNRGFEGLAISPDHGKLWAILQSPLIQDHGLSTEGKRVGLNLRILEVTLVSGHTRELVYTLENEKHGVNEMLAVNDHEFLIIERDGKAGKDTAMRALFRVDITGASDVTGVDSLPASELPANVRPVRKTAWLDFMDPRFGLAGPGMPEKIEGLTFGPTLADGRQTLIVTTDNDLKADSPSWFWVFALAPGDLAPPASASADEGR